MGQPCPSAVCEGFGASCQPGLGKGTLPVTAVPGLLLVVKRERVPARAWVELIRDGGAGAWCRRKSSDKEPASSHFPELGKAALSPREEATLPLAQGGNVAQHNPFTATVWAPLGMGRGGGVTQPFVFFPGLRSSGLSTLLLALRVGSGGSFSLGPFPGDSPGLCLAGTC